MAVAMSCRMPSQASGLKSLTELLFSFPKKDMINKGLPTFFTKKKERKKLNLHSFNIA